MITLLQRKPCYEQVLRASLWLTITLSAIFFPLTTKALWQENFDSFSTGYIRETGIEVDSNASTTIEISNSKSFSSPNSLYFPATSSPIYILNSSSTEPSSYTKGRTSFQFYLSSGVLADGFNYNLRPEKNNFFLAHLKFYKDGSIDYYTSSSGGSYQDLFASSTFSTDTWNILQTKFNVDECVYNVRINDSGWSGDIAMNLAECGNAGYDHIRRTGIYAEANTSVWTDNFSYSADCSSFTDWNTCSLAGCYWGYYSLYLGSQSATGYCTDMPTGSCGSGYDDCQNCTSSTTCEAQDFCFWYLDSICRYGETACAGTSLGLCDNQGDCETAGGYWYDEFCWYSAKPDYFTDWADWYAEHGNYATPTAFIDSIASSTQYFFDNIGGFFGTFNSVFSLNEAYSRGQGLGSAVPVARGYMAFLDDFLGGFPLSEIFIFILIFSLSIGMFRLIARLVQMAKFW